MVQLLYTGTTSISVDLAHREVFRAKVGKGGILCISELHIYISSCCMICR